MSSLKTIAQNKKARHDYFIEESYEAALSFAEQRLSRYATAGLILKTAGARLTTVKFS